MTRLRSQYSPTPLATLLRRIFIVIAVIGILGFVWFATRALRAGPSVVLLEPLDHSHSDTPLVRVIGQTKRTQNLLINGRQIFVDGEGNFAEDILLSPGYNQLSVQALDRFGNDEVATRTLYLSAEPYDLMAIRDDLSAPFIEPEIVAAPDPTIPPTPIPPGQLDQTSEPEPSDNDPPPESDFPTDAAVEASDQADN